MSEPVATIEAAREMGLADDEWARIVEHLGRTPTWPELGVLSAMWSEHCSYKSSKIHLRRLPTEAPWVLQGPGENAGVVEVGDGLAVAFKMESHNHPSYIEPYQGAATGVGGILRDVFTMGARPIASLNALRFGRPDHPRTPYLVDGVVGGIGGYGNCIGVPTVGGDLSFDESYDGNCLVNAFTVGVLKSDGIFRGYASGVGNPVLYVGARTGRDGIHGATMASDSFSEEAEAKRPTVQVGDPFLEKCLLEACLELMKTDVVVGIQDMGAAGLTSSAVEMAARAGNGIEIDCDQVPRRETGMTPYECLLSESQERMLIVARQGCEEDVRAIFDRWDLATAVIGRVTETGSFVITSGGEAVVDLPIAFLADAAPEYDRPQAPPADLAERRRLDLSAIPWQDGDAGATLVALLGSPELCSRRAVWQTYDHTVRLGTVVGPGADAAVVRLKQGRTGPPSLGIALSVGCDQRKVWLDPRRGGALAVAENARNLACVGGRPLAVTDCLNFGNPENPAVMWELSEAIDGISEACSALAAPVVSGNVSLYNETDGVSIKPTPMIAMVGVVEDLDAARAVSTTFQAANQPIVLLGAPVTSVDGLAGSAYLHELHGVCAGHPPAADLPAEQALGDVLRAAISQRLLSSAHDVSDGGLAVCLAECVEGGVGATVTLPSDDGRPEPRPDPRLDTRLDTRLFAENPGRAVVSCPPDALDALLSLASAQGVPAQRLGTTGGVTLTVDGVLSVQIPAITAAREGGLKGLL